MPQLKRSISTILLVAAAFLVASAAGAQTYTVLHAFSGTDGASPYGALVLGSDGNFYGTTATGGNANCQSPAGSCGTVFRMDSSGNLTTLHNFVLGEGVYPLTILQAIDGYFYGATEDGGSGVEGTVPIGCGTIFRIDSAGNLSTLFRFTCDEGSPTALIQASDGKFYGTTNGGANFGTIFRVDLSGNLTTLHVFGNSDGSQPSSLTQASDGDFYGVTARGGNLSECPVPFHPERGCGTIFKIDPSGNLTMIHAFSNSEGALPSSLIQGADGSFYGTTTGGGSCCGTMFRMDAAGNVATIHSFAGSDGGYPTAGLIQTSDGSFYGTTSSGGPNNDGTVFKADSSGNLTILHSFAGSPSDGFDPSGSLVQGQDGNLYGMTSQGGGDGQGTVYRVSPSSAACPLNNETLCLHQGRFLVNAHWTDFQGNSGLASVVSGISSSDSGVMWFFSPDNWELLIKVLNGCGVNGHYWVFGAAATSVEYTIQVTDTQTGEIRTYTNPPGTASPAITDTVAFPGCP